MRKALASPGRVVFLIKFLVASVSFNFSTNCSLQYFPEINFFLAWSLHNFWDWQDNVVVESYSGGVPFLLLFSPFTPELLFIVCMSWLFVLPFRQTETNRALCSHPASKGKIASNIHEISGKFVWEIIFLCFSFLSFCLFHSSFLLSMSVFFFLSIFHGFILLSIPSDF